MKKALLILSLALVAGCSSRYGKLPLQSAAELNRSATTQDESSYMLDAGDQIALTVYGEAELTKTYIIGPDGTIEVPLIGRVAAAGHSVGALSEAIRAGLANGYLRNPSVAAGIAVFRPFYILGEVNKPGEYPYEKGLTLGAATSVAGGYTYRAQQKYVIIHTRDSATEVKARASADLLVLPGDTIRVLERHF